MNLVYWLLFVLYLITLLYILFFDEKFGRTLGSRSYNYNLILFKEIKRFYKYRELLGAKAVFINIICNVIAFIPFGFMVPVLQKHRQSVFTITLLSFELSLLVEVMQLFFRVGSFDVDDLFLNTVGGFIGAVAFVIIRKVRKK